MHTAGHEAGSNTVNKYLSGRMVLWCFCRWVVASDAEAARKAAEEKFPGKVAKLSQASNSFLLLHDGAW